MVAVTILTPVYNGIEFLEECIDSVREQTVADWEMLIGINGHGEDGGDAARIVKEILARKQDSRIRIFIQPPPLKGKVESLNALVKEARADWICLLDCDDKWLPTKLEEQLQFLDTVKDFDVIGTQCMYFGTASGMPHIPSGIVTPTCLSVVNPIINSSAMIRKSLCEWRYVNHGYGIEDYELWMRLSLMGKRLYNLPQVLVFHRLHPASAFNTPGNQDNPAHLQQQYRERLKKKLETNVWEWDWDWD